MSVITVQDVMRDDNVARTYVVPPNHTRKHTLLVLSVFRGDKEFSLTGKMGHVKSHEYAVQ